MRKIIAILTILLFFSCSEDPKQFSEEALKEMVISLEGSKHSIGELLHFKKGKTILIDVWASWCKDCISDFPNLKKIQKQYPDVEYLFLSVDRSKPSWKRAIKKYKLIGDHYNLPKGMNDGDFVDFINLNWISRFIVVDKKGSIKLFKATKSSDEDILKALKN